MENERLKSKLSIEEIETNFLVLVGAISKGIQPLFNADVQCVEASLMLKAIKKTLDEFKYYKNTGIIKEKRKANAFLSKKKLLSLLKKKENKFESLKGRTKKRATQNQQIITQINNLYVSIEDLDKKRNKLKIEVEEATNDLLEQSKKVLEQPLTIKVVENAQEGITYSKKEIERVYDLIKSHDNIQRNTTLHKKDILQQKLKQKQQKIQKFEHLKLEALKTSYKMLKEEIKYKNTQNKTQIIDRYNAAQNDISNVHSILSFAKPSIHQQTLNKLNYANRFDMLCRKFANLLFKGTSHCYLLCTLYHQIHSSKNEFGFSVTKVVELGIERERDFSVLEQRLHKLINKEK